MWGAQKNNLIKTVLLSTHNICFDCEINNFQLHTLIWGPDWTALYLKQKLSQVSDKNV